MANTKKKVNSKTKIKTTKKKTSTKKNTTKKKAVPKTKVSSKKVSSSKKPTTTKKKSNIKKNNIKIVKEEVKLPLKKKKFNYKTIINSIKLFFIKLYKKFIKLPNMFKILWITIILCILLILIELFVFIRYQNNIEKNINYKEAYNDIVIDDNNEVIVGSTDLVKGKFGKLSKDNERAFISIYNNKGELIKTSKYEKGLSTSFKSIIKVNDGFIVVGEGIFSDKELKNEAKEALVVKYDKNLEIIYEKYYQVLTDTSYSRVINTTDGFIALGKTNYANMEVGNSTEGGGIIVKYDYDGNILWKNNHGGSKSGNFNDGVIVNDSIYVVGKDGTDSGNLVKYNLNSGQYQWHKNYNYTDSFGFSSITYLDNYLYVVGSKKIISDENNRQTNNTDALFIKYDIDGNLVYEKTFGGSSFERYNKIILYHNNFYVVGHICSHDSGVKLITNDKDTMTGLIMRYDVNGNILKKEVFGGSDNDNLTSIATDGINYFLTGYSKSNDGNIESSSNNGKNYVGKLIKLNSRFKIFFVN